MSLLPKEAFVNVHDEVWLTAVNARYALVICRVKDGVSAFLEPVIGICLWTSHIVGSSFSMKDSAQKSM